MKLRYLLLIFLHLFALDVVGQDETPEELFEDGDFFFAREDYSEAAYLYRQLLRAEPENHNVHFKLGMAYLNIEGEESKAIEYFLKATENTSMRYRKNYYPEKKAPHHTWFFLGNAYRIDNQLDKALEAYETFKSPKNFEKNYNVRVTDEEIKAVERANIIQDAPIDLYKFCYEEPINTSGKEFNAVVSADEKVLVWVNSQKFYDAIFMAVKQDGKWSRPVNITPQVGSDGDMRPTGLSADGKDLLLVKQLSFDTDIYYSRYNGKTWSKAEPVPGEINSNFTEDHASFYPDGKSIILSSDRRGSIGGLDLWISQKLEDGTWGEPLNAGDKINTENDESSAYIDPGATRLIFASTGHFNMGGYDLFVSDIENDGSFSFPFNIGYPLNTTNNNNYFVPLKDGLSGIYSMRADDGIGNNDIWFIEIIPYEETVAKALTRLSEQNFSITITDPENGKRVTLVYDSLNDRINVISEDGKLYDIVYSRQINEN